jgi:hypothetical protein
MGYLKSKKNLGGLKMGLKKTSIIGFLGFLAITFFLLAFVSNSFARHGELPNRIPEAAPYNVDEAAFFPPPFEGDWTGTNSPGTCDGCHTRIWNDWNGSMMSNAWRDTGWRGAFLLVARLTATDGNCDTPNPPDATTRALINPFADGANCSSTWFRFFDG